MPILLKPFLGCNLRCLYCYERKYRKKKKPRMNYNLDAMLRSLEENRNVSHQICLHGGEPLMMPKEDVRRLLAKMKELTGRSDIQTNGTLIDEEYFQMFKEYNTHVGISYDGPGELSRFRPGTQHVEKTIEKLRREGIGVSLIMVLSKSNAETNGVLNKFKNYLLKLKKMKIGGRINPCGGAPGYQLNPKRLKEVYLELAKFILHRGLKWSPFEDIINGLQGKPRVCTFMGCDSFCTPSAFVIVGDGSITNCMRTNQKEILLRDSSRTFTRDELLSETPQKFGGCQGCRYWSACHGGCPSLGIKGDWRNRTQYCSIWKGLFQFYEKVLSSCGISLSFGTSEATGCKPVDQHIDHFDSSHFDEIDGKDDQRYNIPHSHSNEPSQQQEHGDIPHGDHTDEAHYDAS